MSAEKKEKPVRIALLGNPNSGKTTVFNSLTGSHQHVGNYPGVTVEKIEGDLIWEGHPMHFIDLPGTYSLSPYSIEEIIARDYLVFERPDVIVNVLDSTNLERNLYLTLQLMELDIPILGVFNKSDMAKSQGLEINIEQISKDLGFPIIETDGRTGNGVNRILPMIHKLFEKDRECNYPKVNYGKTIQHALGKISEQISQLSLPEVSVSAQWISLKLLENTPRIQEFIKEKENGSEILNFVKEQRDELTSLDSLPVLIAEYRYAYIQKIYENNVKRSARSHISLSDKIDRIITHKYFGIPIFLCIMYVVFYLTFTLSQYPVELLEHSFEWLGESINTYIFQGETSFIQSLLVDGIIPGVGGVLIFLPNIAMLFLAISILEDSGYMARAAFIMDRVMYRLGLPGRSFIPMLIGFGCSVPAIMATRTLPKRRDRLITMLAIPFMSCGAKMPIYMLLIPTFFPIKLQTPILWGIYLTGILLGIFVIKMMSVFVFKGESSPFIMELPPYHMPTIKNLWNHISHRCWLYIKKAGTIILIASSLFWVLSTYPKGTEQKPAKTYADHIGETLAPLAKPIGFDSQICTALLAGLAAKELFVSQLNVIYVQETDNTQNLQKVLRNKYSSLQALCIILFCLIYSPCIATIAAVKQESNSWKFAIFELTFLSGFAYLICLIVYQTGRWFL